MIVDDKGRRVPNIGVDVMCLYLETYMNLAGCLCAVLAFDLLTSFSLNNNSLTHSLNRYAWAVCVVTLISNALAIGFVFTTSVFYESIASSLSLTRVDVTWIGSISSFSVNGLAIPAGIIVSR